MRHHHSSKRIALCSHRTKNKSKPSVGTCLTLYQVKEDFDSPVIVAPGSIHDGVKPFLVLCRVRKADPEEYQKWWDALMNSTWRNNDWRINHALTWFKVRKVPRIAFDLFLAGWEHSAILLLLDLGIYLRDVTMDGANPKKMMNSVTKKLEEIFGVKYKRVDGSTHL
jgi:hypothetical protein